MPKQAAARQADNYSCSSLRLEIDMKKDKNLNASSSAPGAAKPSGGGEDEWVKTSLMARKSVWEMFDAICWYRRIPMRAGLDLLLTEFVEQNRQDYEAALEAGWKEQKKNRGRK